MSQMKKLILESWDELTGPQIENMWLSLIRNYQLVLKHDGGNDFTQKERHIGKNKKGFVMDMGHQLAEGALDRVCALIEEYRVDPGFCEESEFAKQHAVPLPEELDFESDSESDDEAAELNE